MLTWTDALKLLPADEAKHPDERCRGCAGKGWGGDHVTPRVAQMLGEGQGMGVWKYVKPGTTASRFARITPHLYRARGVIHAPFIIVIAVIEGLEADREWEADPSNAPIDRKYACPWCDGTGVRATGLDAQARWSGAASAAENG